MGQSEHKNVTGELILKYDWQESSSTHYETTDKISLKSSSDNKHVILEELHEDWDIYKTRETKTTRYKIDVSKLVELIKAHGEIEQ